MMLCPKCNGEKFVRKVDIIRAKTVSEQCPVCHGTGQKDGVVPDGVYVKPEPGVLHYWLKYVGGRRVAHIQSIIEKVQPPQGKFLKSDPYFVVSILNMKTRNKDRKKGYCGEILDSIQKWCNSSVKFILTSWDDSNEQSRAYLMKRGFVRKDSVLIWRRNEPAETKCGNRSDSEVAAGTGSGAVVAETGRDGVDRQEHQERDCPELGSDKTLPGSSL